MVTVSSEVQSPPASVFAVSQCGSGSDEFLTLGCLTSGFSPADALKFKWTDSQGKELTEFTQYPAVQTNGSYTSVSHLRLSVSEQNLEESFTCTAEHPAGKKTGSIKMRVLPTLSLVKVSDGNSIMCIFENFFPKDFTVNWKEDGTNVIGVDLPATKRKGVFYIGGSILQVTESKWKNNAEYTCEVKHKSQIYKEKKHFTAALSVKIKGLVVKELFVNNRGVMECVITGNSKQDVKEAKVSWTRENIPETQVTEAEVQNTGEQYTKISTLTFNHTYWFSGNTFKCSATWKQKHISDDISINKIGQKPTILIYKPEEINPHHVSLVCEINSSPSMDVYAIWTTNNQKEYIEGNITSPIFKKNNSKSVFNILTVTKQEYENVSSTFTCAVKYGGMETPNIPLLVATSKNHLQQIVFCYDEEALDEDEFSSLWSTASSFIFLFIFSLIYSTVLSLSKMKS